MWPTLERRDFLSLACLFLSASWLPLSAQVPGEATNLRWCAGPGRDCLFWSAAPRATIYDLYRGEDKGMGCLLSGSEDSCLRRQLTDPFTDPGTITEVPGPGRFFWFLVTGVNALGEGNAGVATTGERQRNGFDRCPAPCTESGAICSSNDQCCSGTCTQGHCEPACCGEPGSSCTDRVECCTWNCANGRCCSWWHGPCSDSSGCCIGPCTDGRCCTPDGGTAANCTGCCSSSCFMNTCGASCKPPGSSCGSSLACCSGVCMAGHCQ